jgi:hypothetical protein
MSVLREPRTSPARRFDVFAYLTPLFMYVFVDSRQDLNFTRLYRISHSALDLRVCVLADPGLSLPTGQVNCLAKGAEARQERVAEMTTLLNQLKQDMMNRTLYALTLVTFLATPVILVSGSFGMNFTDMRELVSGESPRGRA